MLRIMVSHSLRSFMYVAPSSLGYGALGGVYYIAGDSALGGVAVAMST